MHEQQLAQQVEALLFALGRPVARKELTSMLGTDAQTLEGALAELIKSQSGRGVVCVDDGKEVELRAAPEVAELIEHVRKEELTREIGRAGAEALAAVLYRGPLTRSEIDFIRGVNSSQTLRTLLMRGFLRKVPNPKDERSFLYEPTTELLSELGVTHVDDLPEYAVVRNKLRALEETYKQQAES